MKIKNLSKYIMISVVALMFANVTLMPLYAQDIVTSPVKTVVQNTGEQLSRDIAFDVHVVDSTVLISGKTKISLWGIEQIKDDAPVFHLKIRSALEKKINNQKILCNVKSRGAVNMIKAQCINSKEEDLSLFLLQQGYVSADRAAIYGSIYEMPYLEAEEQARINVRGVWGDSDTSSSAGDVQSKNFVMGAFFLMAVFILALGVLSFYIMRGFGRVVDIQNKSIDLAAKERSLKDKEKYIIASMIDAEIKSNKAKIEAYLTIYEESLSSITDSNKTPKYQTTGDIVQKQPGLGRSVFDGNTNKLDLLGARMASSVIHYYARIKTKPDYIDIKPEMPLEDVRRIVETAVNNAHKLNEISDRVASEFIKHALIKDIIA